MKSLSEEHADKVNYTEFLSHLVKNPELLDEIPCAAYLLKDDADLTVICGNSAFYTLFGCTREDMKHKYADRLSALLAPESLRELGILGDDSSRKQYGFKQRIRRSGSDAWIQTHIAVLQDGPYKMLGCLAFDITAAESELKRFYLFEKNVAFIGEQLNLDAFEYDLSSKKMNVICCHNLFNMKIIKELPERTDFPKAVIASGIIHPEYTAEFSAAFDTMRKGGSKVIAEFRMKVGEGEYNWTRMTLTCKRGGDEARRCIIGILQDINQQKEMSMQYLNETQFYQAILSEKTAFAHVDVTEDRCTRFGGIWNLYNEIKNTVLYSALIEEFINKVVHPEDRKHYLELMQRDNFIQSLNNGIDQLGCEFRRIVEQNKMVWMELKVHLFQDPSTHHIFALLHIKDIDEKKKQELALLHDSERDHLTNIYNKKMAENSIRNRLKQIGQSEICAFLILDMDNFKYINDAYGHSKGDQVLIRLTELLDSAFSRNDIIGRFGGDEFVLFLSNIVSKEKVRQRLEIFYQYLKKETDPDISCSIGITLVYQGDSYHRIFRQADIALYSAKNEGKGKYVFFNGNEMRESPAALDDNRARYSVEHLIGEADDTEEVSFDAFLAEQGEMAYLVDPGSFSLICGNKAFYDRIGMTQTECLGVKCYEAMHKRDSPCPFCSKANWSTDKFYMWRNMNEALEQEFLIKNKLVQWKNREVLLALAIDISNNKSIVDSMDNGATESHSILGGVQRMAEASTLAGTLSSALETIGSFFRADAVHFWERESQAASYHCTNAWTRNRKKVYFGEKEVNVWLQRRKWEQQILIESPETMLCYSYDMYKYMKGNNIENQRWIRLRDGEQELGCIAVENITSNFQNVAFLESFSVFIAGEIKKRRLMEGVLYSNTHDDLTGLLGRNSYERYLQNYSGDKISTVGVMVANLDNLKGINSTKGFPTGNYYLKQFANMLKEVFRNGEVYRLNGDEFLVVVTEIDRIGLEAQIQKLKAMVEDNGIFTVSIGYSWDNVENDLALLIEQATIAMKAEKKRHYDKNMTYVDTERRKMLSELILSLENHKFEVFLQPKVELSYNKVVGAEALVRYRHEKLGIITPDKFIDTLERNNLIRYVDLFVFEEVCKILEKWKHAGLMQPIISLNFSRITLLERDILESMEKIINKYDISRRFLEIEITESVAGMGKSILYQAARELYEAGFSISLDDFGTNYANLSILADIDFSMLKLDKSLIGELADHDSNQIILKNIIYMCKDLGIEVIAEGIETQDQEEVLKKLKCTLGQGYLYGKPMPIDEFDMRYNSLKQKNELYP